MKGCTCIILIVFLGLLSSCAYIQGVRDQRTTPKAERGFVPTPSASSSVATGQENPAASAAQIVRPVTQHLQ